MAVSEGKGTQRWIWLGERALSPFFTILFSHTQHTRVLDTQTHTHTHTHTHTDNSLCNILTLICDAQLQSCCTHRAIVCGGQTEWRAQCHSRASTHTHTHTHTPYPHSQTHNNTCTMDGGGVLQQRTTRQSNTLLFYVTEGGMETTMCWETDGALSVINTDPWPTRSCFDSSTMKRKGCKKRMAANNCTC